MEYAETKNANDQSVKYKAYTVTHPKRAQYTPKKRASWRKVVTIRRLAAAKATRCRLSHMYSRWRARRMVKITPGRMAPEAYEAIQDTNKINAANHRPPITNARGNARMQRKSNVVITPANTKDRPSTTPHWAPEKSKELVV
eukprot:CAMPEP_0184646092 /NCGR_PEP_ID=MMETSP0308-20130426/2736_1 /TAXON_ID=38269 /ORGANISM="Gloeochaete witrockiana, Strain SAG 46.84" /LENGTH=141 /DNA_ID=CAMNT_0027075779 /DNA_START=1431 /DNA_END=1856 /DNA_ORIENTATION=+